VLQTPNTTRPLLLDERFAELGGLLTETCRLTRSRANETGRAALSLQNVAFGRVCRGVFDLKAP
jgi:hypothetical protein